MPRLYTWVNEPIEDQRFALRREFDNIYDTVGGASSMADGTEALPGWPFTNDTDTGFFREVANTLGVGAFGKAVARFTGTSTVAVNEFELVNANTGVAPILRVRSDNDANVGFTIEQKGTGTMTVQTAGAGNLVLATTGTTRYQIGSAGNMACNNNLFTGVGVGANGANTLSLSFGGDTDTGFFRSAADEFTISTGGASRLTATNTAINAGTNLPFVPGAVSGIPAQHGLFRENVMKAWVRADSSQNISDSFNVSGVVDNGLGDITVTWDRDFANDTYVCGVAVQHDAASMTLRIAHTPNAPTVGSARFLAHISGVATDPQLWNITAIGDQ